MAERDLEKALELNPTFVDAQLNLDQVKRDIKSNTHNLYSVDQT